MSLTQTLLGKVVQELGAQLGKSVVRRAEHLTQLVAPEVRKEEALLTSKLSHQMEALKVTRRVNTKFP
jgi:hypothetical protein